MKIFPRVFENYFIKAMEYFFLVYIASFNSPSPERLDEAV